MKATLRVTLPVLAAVLALASANALHFCADPPLLDVDGRYYVAEDCLDDGCHGSGLSLWVYEESNGAAGLQRGGGCGVLCGPSQVPDPCVASANPDLLLF